MPIYHPWAIIEFPIIITTVHLQKFLSSSTARRVPEVDIVSYVSCGEFFCLVWYVCEYECCNIIVGSVNK